MSDDGKEDPQSNVRDFKSIPGGKPNLPPVLGIYAAVRFKQEFEPAEDPRRRESMEFKPDWSKYPRLAARLDGATYAEDDLVRLLVAARADAVQYVHDVRVDELQKTRADERHRIADHERLLGDALCQTLVRIGVLKPGVVCTGPELLAAASSFFGEPR